jgi:hypothetical protein
VIPKHQQVSNITFDEWGGELAWQREVKGNEAKCHDFMEQALGMGMGLFRAYALMKPGSAFVQVAHGVAKYFSGVRRSHPGYLTEEDTWVRVAWHAARGWTTQCHDTPAAPTATLTTPRKKCHALGEFCAMMDGAQKILQGVPPYPRNWRMIP